MSDQRQLSTNQSTPPNTIAATHQAGTMISVATPRTSHHAELRMLQRAGVDSPTVLHSWNQATPVTIEYKNYSQTKYDETLEVILLEQDGVVTTVLRAAYEEFANSEEGQ